MRRSTTRDASDRVVTSLSRTLLTEADDSKLMQEISIDLFHNEKMEKIERVQDYGFSSYPKKPTGESPMRRAAEAFISFLTGNRSHGVAFVVGDRRFRLYKMKEGEVALHDDQGQWIHLKRGGILVKAPNGQTITVQIDKASDGSSSSSSLGQDSTQVPKSVASVTLTKGTIAAALSTGTISATIGSNVSLVMTDAEGGSITATVQQTDETITDTDIIHDTPYGVTRLGSDGASLPVSVLGTVDTGGFLDVANFASKVFTE